MKSNSEDKDNFDEKAFNVFFNKEYLALRNFIYYKTGDFQLAEDLVQETFVKLWQKRDEIIPGKVKYLSYTIANNLSINYFKHLKIVYNFRNAYLERHEHNTPEYLLEEKEFDKRLQQALGSLSEKHRMVFLMNRIDKMTYIEIAERLGLSVKAIEKRMSLAIKELNTLLGVKI